MLLIIEVILLSLALIIPFFGVGRRITNVAVILILLTGGVCEAAMGLAVLVILVRRVGNDRMESLSCNGIFFGSVCARWIAIPEVSFCLPRMT